MGFLRAAVSILRFFVPVDNSDKAGYGPFKLPDNHPFQRAGQVHDFYFEEAKHYKTIGLPLGVETRDEADIKLFRMFAFIAMNAATPKRKIELMLDCCSFWPLARQVGEFIWKGPIDQ